MNFICVSVGSLVLEEEEVLIVSLVSLLRVFEIIGVTFIRFLVVRLYGGTGLYLFQLLNNRLSMELRSKNLVREIFIEMFSSHLVVGLMTETLFSEGFSTS